uniref:Uncharacterized protein n=1 Tax=Arundo donax TaxID=35708 RepID=A0A0A9BB23_ARUDO
MPTSLLLLFLFTLAVSLLICAVLD